MTVTVLIKKITVRWCETGIIEKSDEDVYEYGLDLLLYTILNIAVILFSAAFIGKIAESIALLAVILPLQSFGGGYHAKTHLRCFLIMYIGWWAVILLLPLIKPAVAVAMSCAAVFVVYRLAPVPHVNVTMSDGQRAKMQKLARQVVGAGAVVSIFLSIITSERIGTAMSAGLGVTALSILIAHGKNMLMEDRK